MPTQLCRHVRTNGVRCQAAALTNQSRCRWHADLTRRHEAIQPHGNPSVNTLYHNHPDTLRKDPTLMGWFQEGGGRLELDFPALEDRESIQVAISMVVVAVAHERINTDRARLLLYGLQVASSNARNLTPPTGPTVTDIIRDETGSEIAAPRRSRRRGRPA